MNMPDNCPEALDPLEVRDVTRSTGIEFTLHSPDELDLGSLHPTVREGHLGRMREALGWSAQAGVKVLNMHLSPGIYFTLPDRRVWIYDRYVDEFTANLWTAYQEMIPLARASGVDICTENVNNFDLPFVAQAVDELCCLDVLPPHLGRRPRRPQRVQGAGGAAPPSGPGAAHAPPRLQRQERPPGPGHRHGRHQGDAGLRQEAGHPGAGGGEDRRLPEGVGQGCSSDALKD